ncbi:uncharacterized protein [Antedon mediterranea]|uniref:uncharacterized protein n=1 Tax=Antedon mediterranea TaxID=105859 RepID=UPI003AF565AC
MDYSIEGLKSRRWYCWLITVFKMSINADSVGVQFATYYYETYDKDRSKLESLFVDVSTMTFEGERLIGKKNIIDKLKSLPSNTMHVTSNIDSQLTVDNGVFVQVNGQLKFDNDSPHYFTESFYLKQEKNSWVVLNLVFRLSLHHN